MVDMVLHEVTRHQTSTSQVIATWTQANQLPVVTTKVLKHFQHLQATSATPQKKSHLGELAIQETMNDFALMDLAPIGVFLFEDHKIGRTSFLLPDNCRKVSTRAFLLFLEQKGWLLSAAEVERQAILNGRSFSQLHFSPGLI